MHADDSRDSEQHIKALMYRGQWADVLVTIDEWLTREPWRTELLLRKAQALRALQRDAQGLAAVREYRRHRPDDHDIAFQEIEILLALGQVAAGQAVLDDLPETQRTAARGEYYQGRVMLARREFTAGLQALWRAYHREPSFNRALVDWATAATRQYGKMRVKQRLEALLVAHANHPAVAVSVGLALATIDTRRGRTVLRHAVKRHPDYAPTVMRLVEYDLPDLADAHARTMGTRSDYRLVCEHLLAGHLHEAVETYYRAVKQDPVWMPLLAPVMAELLTDELLRPEDARQLLEEALRQAPTDYRLHLGYVRVLLRLHQGEEALSAANCGLAQMPEAEQAVMLVFRAAAYTMVHQRDRARADLTEALTRMPEARGLIHTEHCLRPLSRDPRFRAVMNGRACQPAPWERLWRWLVGT